MNLRHPSKQTLSDWLTGTSAPEVDEHVATCQRCATTLEEFDNSPELAIGDALAEVFAPADGLTRRLEEGVTARLSSRQVIDLVAELFGAGFETTRLLLIEDTDDDN